jgi:hypothetical protein
LRLAHTGAATVSNGLTLTAGNISLASGAGIDFSADPTGSGTSTSQLLDDYEEGTWTPSVGGDATYSARTGTYVKIGKIVHITCDITISVLGTGSESTISGLPFVCGTLSSVLPATYFQGLSGSYVNVIPRVDAGGSSIFMGSLASAASIVTATTSILQNNARIVFCGTYEVA